MNSGARSRSRDGFGSRRAPTPAATPSATEDPPQPPPPRALLWSVGIAAGALSAIALLLWGLQGPAALFDTIVAICG